MPKCDACPGDVLDAFDRDEARGDSMLAVWPDHGFMRGEPGWMAKIISLLCVKIARTPLFILDPHTRRAGECSSAPVQPSVALVPTILRHVGLESTAVSRTTCFSTASRTRPSSCR